MSMWYMKYGHGREKGRTPGDAILAHCILKVYPQFTLQRESARSRYSHEYLMVPVGFYLMS